MKDSTNVESRLSLTVTVFFMVSLCLALFIFGFSNVHGVEVFSKDEKPFGTPYADWLTKYWQWWIAVTPEQSEPPNGSCMMNKSGSMVMLFQPAVGGKHDLECEISTKDGIMIPSWNGFYNEPSTVPVNRSLEAKKQVNWGAVTSDVKVDGKSVAKLDEITSKDGNYKVNTIDNFTEIYSKPFNITIPENTNLPDQVTGTSPAGAQGWYSFLKPLPPGDHKVTYTLSVQGLGADNVASEISYLFHVKTDQTGNSTMNTPSNNTMLNSNTTNKSSSLNATLPNQLPPESINASKMAKI